MASQTRIMQQIQDLNTFQEILEMVKDPKAIDKVRAVHDEMRKQQALTNEQAVKAAEAKDFIARHAQLQKDLTARESKLASDVTAHEKDKADSVKVFDTETARLTNIGKGLDEKVKIYAVNTAQLEKDRRDLDAYKRKLDSEHGEKIRQVEIREAAAEKDRNSNAAESQRLALYDQKLKAKFAKFQEAAAI